MAERNGKPGWQADTAVIAALEAKKSPAVYRETDLPAYTLPDPLRAADGSMISTREQWERKRRPETLALFEKYVYGRQPVRPEQVEIENLETDSAALGGAATRKRVRIVSHAEGKSYGFEAGVLIPNGAPGKVPAVLLINNRPPTVADVSRKTRDEFWPAEEIVRRGYAAAVFRTWDVDPDQNGDKARAAGVRGVFRGPGEAGKDAWATIAAWAWGASRVLDFLEQEPAVDAKRVMVIGHSRGGKTALWAGATDLRFAMAVSNESGCGGAALSRRTLGETVKIINGYFPFWFCGNFHAFDGREADLPIDQHQLIALMAPRPVCVGSASDDLWADPRGEFLSLAAASRVYQLYGDPPIGENEMPPLDTSLVCGHMHYHVRTGGHNLSAYDWARYLNFADRFLKP